MGKRRLILVCGGVLLITGLFALNGFTVAKGAAGNLLIEQVGKVNPAQIQQKYPAYVELMELKRTYDNQLNNYAIYIRSQQQSYLVELDKQKQAEMEGKSESERREIEAKYQRLVQDKELEVNQLIRTKFQELQDRLNQETAKADDEVKRAIDTVCSKNGFVIVLNITAVYYGGQDITELVIAEGIAESE